MRVNVCDRHNMDTERDAATVNKTPCLQHGQNMHHLDTCRQITDPENVGIPSNMHDTVSQPMTDRSETLQLEFQDSQMSPALTLLPCLDKSQPFSDSTFFQHTDAEFAPLRGFPDLSVISERCPRMSHVGAVDDSHLQETIHEQATLSQHPLEVPAALSEAESSCCSLSQHSLSPRDHYKEVEEQVSVFCEAESKVDRHMEGEEQSPTKQPEGVSAVISSTAVYSASEIAPNQLESASKQSNTAKSQLEPAMNLQTDLLPSSGIAVEEESCSREQPQGGSLSLSFQKTAASAVSHITIRESWGRSHEIADQLHNQLVSKGQRGSLSAPGSRQHSGNRSSHSGLYVTPASAGGMQMPGLQKMAWSSGNLTAADGSYLSSHPVSQSTPAVPFMRPQPALTNLSLVHSQEEAVTSAVDKHSSPICTQTTVTVTNGPSLGSETTQTVSHAHRFPNEQGPPTISSPPQPDAPSSESRSFHSGTKMKDQVSALALGRVQSLPSLSYLQKVDAWTASQISSRSFYDNLPLKGFDAVSPKNKDQDAVSTAPRHMLFQDTRQPQMSRQALSSSISGSFSPRQMDVIGAGLFSGQASQSPVNHSQSHSSLSSVVTSIQRGNGSHSQHVPETQNDNIIPTTKSLGSQSSLLSGRRTEGGNNSSVTLMDKSSVKLSPLASLGRFSDVSSSFNMSSTISSSQGSCHAEQSMRASVGAASSVVSLEVDNYAPYWISRPASPPQSRELNIEDRIPLYLLNLGIDQSPSTILNPFTYRGPIREPEFSPTDLCTIKGSIGTPTKSTQTSEVDSPQKEAFSSSSQFSADSSSSVTHRLSVHKQGQSAVQRSVKTMLSQTDALPQLHSTLHPSSCLQHSDTQQSESSFGLSSQLSPESVPPSGPREEVKDEDSLVSSGTLNEIRRLLDRAESLVSGRSSLTSSPGSHRLSESDTSLVSLGRNAQGYHDNKSLSAGGNFSLLFTRSSSDSALKGSLSSSQGVHQLSAQTDCTITDPDALSLSRDDSMKSRDLCVTPRRAEPEGCSAADPDKGKLPTALSVKQTNVPVMAVNLPQNQEKTENAVVGSSENSPSHVSAEAGSLSDSGSESSLAARVAKLLQSESPVSMVTSRPSTTDPEDSRAREWILMKLSGHQCESLELNAEDRKRIEDIKRELLLNTQHTKWSSDSEGGSQSSVGAGFQPGKGFIGIHNMESLVSDQLQKASQKPIDSNVLLYMPKQQDLEAKVHQIALREGFSPPSLTSISIATSRRTPSPMLPSQCPGTGTMELGNLGSRHGTLEQNVHYSGTDTNPGAGYHHKRHQPAIITNVSDREGQMDGGGKPSMEKEGEVTANDAKENSVQNDPQIFQTMPQIDAQNTGNNKVLSSVVSETTPTNKSHLSHIHVTLSPRSKDQSLSSRYHSSRLSNQNSFQDVRSPRHSTTMSIPTEEKQQFTYKENEDVLQGQNGGRVNPRLQARYPETFTSTQRLVGTSRTLPVQMAAVPVLLPYKPHGSSELFYVPQAKPQLSPGRSDTTIESSHPGSDDAVAPCFNTDILGSRELEDNGVMPKHKEGIYSKRASIKTVYSNVSRSGLPEPTVSITGRYNTSFPEASKLSEKDMNGDYEDHFVPLHMEADYSTDDLHLHNRTMMEPKLPLEPQRLSSQSIENSYRVKEIQDRRPHDVSVVISSSLDQLWRRFSEKWSMDETRPTNERDTSLLDRLERLSRLIHSTTPKDKSIKQPDSTNRACERRADEEEAMRPEDLGLEMATQQTWAEQEEIPENVRRCPAEKDESSSMSMETSTSMSTIDTGRLLRAFGPHRVTSKGLKSSDSMLKLHNTINKQKSGRRKPSTKHAAVSVSTENISTDDSIASPGYLSSSSTLSLSSQRGASHSFTTKRPKVKLVSKSVQAGDLEIVINGTRRHTRDVGTIFPSPSVSSNAHTTNTFSKGFQAIPIHPTSTANSTQTSALKRDSCSKSIRTRCPNGVSWFVSADELKFDGRKENQPQNESAVSVNQAWFEPYSRTQPWRESVRETIREPLRERQIQEEQEKPESRPAMRTNSSDKPSSLVRLSLQEALELHRPKFVSQSRERMKRLELLVEERRLQAVFSRERDELFNRPGPSRPLIQAPVPRKRVVPKREMVQRSKQKYAQLPEVQKRREEEKRQTEYSSYRLNAQLFNKKVTNRVLGRRAPWQ